MNFLVGMALRNLTRNVKRTFITSVAVVAGVALMIVGFGFIDGLDENVVRATINNVSGHVLLRPAGFDPNDNSSPIKDLKPLPDTLVKALEPYAWTTRLNFDVTLMHGQDSLRARGVAYDPATDERVFSRANWKVDGKIPDTEGVVLGTKVAKVLGVKVGDTIFAQARTARGAINALGLEVVAVVNTGVPTYDNYAALMPMPQAQILVAADGPSQVTLRLDDRNDAMEVAAAITPSAGDWQVGTWHEEVKDILAVNAVRRRAITVLVFMIMAIAATGIANTVIMAAYERVREIGTLAALGMPPNQIRAMFLLEGGFMGLISASVGALVGGLATWRWSVVGIDLSQAMEGTNSAIPVETMLYANFTTGPLIGGLAFGLGVAVLASLIPAQHAAHLNPADAVRAD